jgi:hypothetical protein
MPARHGGGPARRGGTLKGEYAYARLGGRDGGTSAAHAESDDQYIYLVRPLRDVLDRYGFRYRCAHACSLLM